METLTEVECVLMAPNAANWQKAEEDNVQHLLFWIWPTWIQVDQDVYWPAENHDGGWRCAEMNIDMADLRAINQAWVAY